MNHLMNKIKLQFAYRKTIKSTISKNNPNITFEQLKRYPELNNKIIMYTKSLIQYQYNWEGLLLCLGLIQDDYPNAMKFIRLLDLSRELAPWWEKFRKYIEVSISNTFLFFIMKNGNNDELRLALNIISEKQANAFFKQCVKLLDIEDESKVANLRPVLIEFCKFQNWATLSDETVHYLINLISKEGGKKELDLLFKSLITTYPLRAINLIRQNPIVSFSEEDFYC